MEISLKTESKKCQASIRPILELVMDLLNGNDQGLGHECSQAVRRQGKPIQRRH